MKNLKKIICLLVTVLCVVASLSACNKADNIKHNISRQSDAFESYREVTLINLRSDKVLMQVEGYISIKNNSNNELAIIVMEGPGAVQDALCLYWRRGCLSCKAERKFYNRSLSLGYQNFCRVPENCRGLRGFYDLPKLRECQV